MSIFMGSFFRTMTVYFSISSPSLRLRKSLRKDSETHSENRRTEQTDTIRVSVGYEFLSLESMIRFPFFNLFSDHYPCTETREDRSQSKQVKPIRFREVHQFSQVGYYRTTEIIERIPRNTKK